MFSLTELWYKGNWYTKAPPTSIKKLSQLIAGKECVVISVPYSQDLYYIRFPQKDSDDPITHQNEVIIRLQAKIEELERELAISATIEQLIAFRREYL